MEVVVDIGQTFEKRIPIGFGGFPAGAVTDGTHSVRGFVTHGREHMRGLFFAGGARGAGGDGEPRFIEADHPLQFAVAIRHQGGNRVPQARGIDADDAGAGERAQEFAFEIIAPHAAQNVFTAGNLFFAHFQGGDESGNGRNVFGAGAASAFLFATVEKGNKLAARGDFQETDAAWAAEFMGGAADEIALTQTFRGHFTDELDGIGEEGDLVLATNGESFAPGLDHASFVVGGHARDQSGAGISEFSRQPVEVDDAITGDRNEAGTFAKVMLRGIQHAGMFNGGNPDFASRAELAGKVMQNGIISFGGPAGPDDVHGVAVEKSGKFFPGIGQGNRGPGAGLMHGGRVATDLLGDMLPGFARLAHDRRGGVIIEVDHRSDMILLIAAVASFLWAALKASF